MRRVGSEKAPLTPLRVLGLLKRPLDKTKMESKGRHFRVDEQ